MVRSSDQPGPRGNLLAIPGLGAQDVAVISSLLTSAGFRFEQFGGFGEGTRALILIGEADLDEIKTFLRDYRVTGDNGRSFPIPW